jgi:hypothetical protein
VVADDYAPAHAARAAQSLYAPVSVRRGARGQADDVSRSHKLVIQRPRALIRESTGALVFHGTLERLAMNALFVTGRLLLEIASAGFGVSLGFAVKNWLEYRERAR